MSARRVAVAIALVTLLAAPTASALKEECPTWFPDFADCGRSGRFEGFVPPMQMPYLFEDPFITTGLSLWGLYHEYPNDSIFDGGHLWALALQARVAITDRLAFIATKDGYVWHRPGLNILSDEDGFFDIAAGFKYALFQDREKNYIISPSLRFDIPVGQNRVFSGNGDGVLQPGISGAWGTGKFHVIADLGGRVPFNNNKETTQFFWNLHLDYALFDWFVPFFEAGGLHYTGSGKGDFEISGTGLTLTEAQDALMSGRFDAVDVANLGSKGVVGNDIVVGTFGLRARITKHLIFGGSWGIPLTGRRDIWRQRASLNLTWEY